MSFYQFIVILCTLFLCGAGFSWYEWARRMPTSSWGYHLLQWIPLLGGAICFFIAGYLMQEDTGFAFFGVTSSIFVSPCIGYVVGRKLWFG